MPAARTPASQRIDAAPADTLDSDARYLALKTRDARFDGQFFTGVTSTGIYCRPVCKVRTPKRENCRFFTLAAQAEAAGFRPCLRCRPELAPALGASAVWSTQDASALLAQSAAQLIDALACDDPALQGGATEGARMQGVASRLGVSDRHLRRIFEAAWGLSPLQYLQTRRLLAAKQLLTDTQLPMAQVATLSGFASVRRFNDAFVKQYRLAPRDLRRTLPGPNGPGPVVGPAVAAITVRASYRPPYDVAAMLEFLHQRHLPGMEMVDREQQTWRRSLRLAHQSAQGQPRVLQGWFEASFDATAHQVTFRVSDSLRSALPYVMRQLRAALDLDADPMAIEAQLGAHFPGQAGIRVPGTVDGLELAVRAVLGQQVSVSAARTLALRLLDLGTAAVTPWPEIHRCFPTAAELLDAGAQTLGALGVVRQRQAAILALADAVLQGGLQLVPGAPMESTLKTLLGIKGIGPWTAQYIAMRALRWPDAFPSGDVALHNALGVRGTAKPALEAEKASAAWRPWRSYAVVRAWRLLPQHSQTNSPSAPTSPISMNPEQDAP